MARRSDHTRPELRELAVAAAAQIIETHGLKEVSIRKIASGMGYTSGTLYQLFPNLDALIFEVNAATLRALQERALLVDLSQPPQASLSALAGCYLTFARERPKALAAVFEHHSGRRDQAPEDYDEVVLDLIGLGAQAIVPLVPDPQARIVEARVLWSALYGIVSLALAENQSRLIGTETLLEALVATYVAGLSARYGT